MTLIIPAVILLIAFGLFLFAWSQTPLIPDAEPPTVAELTIVMLLAMSGPVGLILLLVALN